MADNLIHLKTEGLSPIPKKRKKLTTLRENEKNAEDKKASMAASGDKSSSATASETFPVSVNKETNSTSYTASTPLRVTRSTSAGSSRSEPKASSGALVIRESSGLKQASASIRSNFPANKGKEPMRTPPSEDDFAPDFIKSNSEKIKKSNAISKDDELLLTVDDHIWTEADLVDLSNVSSEEKNRLCVSHAMKLFYIQSVYYANGVLQDNILLKKDLVNKDKMVSSLSKEVKQLKKEKVNSKKKEKEYEKKLNAAEENIEFKTQEIDSLKMNIDQIKDDFAKEMESILKDFELQRNSINEKIACAEKKIREEFIKQYNMNLAVSYRMGWNDRGESNPNKHHFDGPDEYDDANGVHSICPELDIECAAEEENSEKGSDKRNIFSHQITDKASYPDTSVVNTSPADVPTFKDTSNPLSDIITSPTEDQAIPGAFTSVEEDQATLSEMFNAPPSPKLD